MADSFTERLRRLDDADLTPHQFRLLMHYWRIGQCWETVRTTAEKCAMSIGHVSETRKWLLERGWIEWRPIEVRGKIRMAIALCSPHEQTQQLNGCSCSPDEQRSPHEQECSPDEQEAVAVVHPVNAILNEPQDLNEPLEEKREERPPPPTPSPADDDDEETQIAWEAAQEIMAFWCELVGEVAPATDEQRRRKVSTHYGPITLLWQRLDSGVDETKRLLRLKYEEMLADGLRPSKPAAVIPQIFGDLTAAKLPSANGRSPPRTGKGRPKRDSLKDKVAEAKRRHGLV